MQEHTARMVPETEATPYDRILLALAPKYLSTEAWDTNVAMAPAMKKAGIRQVKTCSRAYSWSIIKASSPDCRMTGLLQGTKYAARKIPIRTASLYISLTCFSIARDYLAKQPRIAPKFFTAASANQW